MAHLAPAVVDAILAGTQPTALSARVLLSVKLPLTWREQQDQLVIA